MLLLQAAADFNSPFAEALQQICLAERPQFWKYCARPPSSHAQSLTLAASVLCGAMADPTIRAIHRDLALGASMYQEAVLWYNGTNPSARHLPPHSKLMAAYRGLLRLPEGSRVPCVSHWGVYEEMPDALPGALLGQLARMPFLGQLATHCLSC